MPAEKAKVTANSWFSMVGSSASEPPPKPPAGLFWFAIFRLKKNHSRSEMITKIMSVGGTPTYRKMRVNYYQRLFYLFYRLTKWSNVKLQRYSEAEIISQNLIGIQIVTGYYAMIIFGGLREVIKKMYSVTFTQNEMQMQALALLLCIYLFYFFQIKRKKKYLKIIETLDGQRVNLRFQFVVFVTVTLLLTLVFLFISS